MLSLIVGLLIFVSVTVFDAFLQSLCSWDPFKRPTAAEVLRHPFFQVIIHLVVCFLCLISVNLASKDVNGHFKFIFLFLLQNCFCVPPSLRAKTTVHRTPPSLGTRGYSEQKSARKSSGSGSLPVSKTTNLKPHVAFGAGVQRKLDMDGKDLNKNDKSVKSSVKQPKYRPPIKNSSCKLLSQPKIHDLL